MSPFVNKLKILTSLTALAINKMKRIEEPIFKIKEFLIIILLAFGKGTEIFTVVQLKDYLESNWTM